MAARRRQATAARIDDRSPGMRVRDASMLLWAWHTFQRPMPAAVLEARAAPRPASWSRGAWSRALLRRRARRVARDAVQSAACGVDLS